jgi:hypothetical protein
LPTTGPEYLVFLRNQYKDCESHNNGKISANDFLKVPLWFEESSEHDVTKFDRPVKLKLALAHLFGGAEINEGQFKEDGEENIVEEADEPIEETVDEIPDDGTAITRGNGADIDIEQSRRASLQPSDPSSSRPATHGLGAAILNEHELVIEHDACVDIEKFLMMSTLDIDGKLGIEKAFALYDDGEGLTVSQIHEVCNYWFHLVPDSHRDATVKTIFPLEMFQAAFGDEKVGFAEFASSEGMAGVLSSPIYLLEELLLGPFIAKGSRPGTAGK